MRRQTRYRLRQVIYSPFSDPLQSMYFVLSADLTVGVVALYAAAWDHQLSPGSTYHATIKPATFFLAFVFPY